ncbi:hypothetical protein GQ42DRAFT_79258 [Ramicandelaber brevisporus]|nr:hypothetical protein GQ42DRAFT_79258 [Ramicandelaber brevisporus]
MLMHRLANEVMCQLVSERFAQDASNSLVLAGRFNSAVMNMNDTGVVNQGSTHCTIQQYRMSFPVFHFTVNVEYTLFLTLNEALN